MPFTLCTQCSASVPGEARFCPRCGHQVATLTARPERAVDGGTSSLRRDEASSRPAGALPSSSPMPLAGILFLAAAVLGPTMVAIGVSTSQPVLLVAGIGIAVVLIAVILIGMVF